MTHEERTPLHARSLPGVVSEEAPTWRGMPMRGLYFVESRLAEGARPDTGRGPAVLLPGSWDPHQGEYSNAVLRSLLEEAGAPSVFEAHYRFEGQDGRFEPDAVVADLVDIFLDAASPPTVVGLCLASPFVLEALLAACERDPAPPVAGVLVIGNGVPGHLNRLGRMTFRNYTNKTIAAISKRFSYAGHNFTSDNIVRGEQWLRESRLTAALARAEKDGPITPFPVPVESLYFRFDISTREVRALTRRVFGIERAAPLIPGYHRSLRRPSPADDTILAFYESTQAAARAKAPGATGED